LITSLPECLHSGFY